MQKQLIKLCLKYFNVDSFLLLSDHCNIFITVIFTCKAQIIEVQISYPGTSPESREPDLSFATKLDRISGLIV